MKQQLPILANRSRIEIDVPTLIAVSTVAWALVDVLHEVVGHVGSAVLLGIPVNAVSTVGTFRDTIDSLWASRTYLASGTVVNFVTGGLALLALRSRMVMSAASRYFLWLFAMISLMWVPANLIAGGDWMSFAFSFGLEPFGLWRAGIVAAGMLMAVVGYVLPLRLWMPDLRENRGLQLKITAIPVAVFIAVQMLSMVPNPFAALPIGGSIWWNTGPRANALVLLIATPSALWLARVNLVQRPRSAEPVESIRLTRSTTWLAAGLIMFVIFVAVLRPGLGRAPRVTILPPEEGAAYAAGVDEIVENSLTGLSENDFAMFSRDIDPSQLAARESIFPQYYDEYIGVLGATQSKTLDHVEDQPYGRVVIYRAAFENDSDVPVRIFFRIYDPDHLFTMFGVGD